MDIDALRKESRPYSLAEVKQQVINLEKAMAIIQAQPESSVDLARYSNHCGTIFCSVGHLAQNQFFIDLGLRLEYQSCPSGSGEVRTELCTLQYDGQWRPWFEDEGRALNKMFGPNSFNSLFLGYGTSNLDGDIIPMGLMKLRRQRYDGEAPKEAPTDKQLALKRLALFHGRQILRVAKMEASNG